MIEINNKKLCESCFAEIGDEKACPHCGYIKSEYTPDPMVLPIGTKLNEKIVIGRVMGKGGFGITYFGYDLRMDKIIAVKEYYPNGISYRDPARSPEVTVVDTKSLETFEKGAEKFYTEAKMVSQFNGNPNIVSVYDYFRANGTVYLVMEYISGITLKNYIKRHGVLTDGQALFVMDKIVAALSITHSAGVLHRDISPDNIMICGNGRVKLIDFGAAREIVAESSSNLTVVMKPGYTPIEQYTKKGKQGAWTDIYSLGVSIYYALTGIIMDDPYARMDEDGEFSSNKHSINESMWEILKKCTMINSSDRYGSAIDLRKALRSVSAPLKAEEITLDDEDLRGVSEDGNSGTSSGTLPAEDDFPETTAAPEITAEPSAEDIQVFEESEPEISEAASGEEADSDAKGENAAKKINPKILAGVGAAAAVIALIVVLTLNGNRHSVPVDSPESTFSEALTGSDSVSPSANDEKVTIEFEPDHEYIEKQQLQKFGGAVKVTLELETRDTFASLNRMVDSDGKTIPVSVFNRGVTIDEDGKTEYYMLNPDITEFSFVIEPGAIYRMNEAMYFPNFQVGLKTATLEPYNPAEYAVGADAKIIELNGTPGQNTDFISKSEFESFDGDVRVTLTMEYIENESENIPHGIAWDDNRWGKDIKITAENDPHVPWGDPNYFELGTIEMPETVTFTISRDEIEKLDRGLLFWQGNSSIKTAALEKAQ